MSASIVVYSAVFSDVDEICDVSNFLSTGIRFVLFTDSFRCDAPGWEVVVLPRERDPILANRRLKIMPPDQISGYDYNIYIDGNVYLEQGFPCFVSGLLVSKADLAVNKHPRFPNVFLDLHEIVHKGVIKAIDGERDLLALERLGMKPDLAFYECNIIWRSNRKEVIEFCRLWWAHYVNGSGRDQSAFVKAVFQHDIKVLNLNLGDIRTSPGQMLSIRQHRRRKSRLERAGRLVRGAMCGELLAFRRRIRKHTPKS